MKEVLVSDAGGATLRLADYGGKTLRPLFFNEESLKSSHCLPLRPDDIILCSYPKSGCHWTWDISRMLLDGDMSNINCQHKEDFMLENTTVKKAEMMTSPRLLTTHMQFSELPVDDLRKHQNKIIFVYRNPKDLAVSLYYLHRSNEWFDYNGKFDDYLSLFFSGNVDYGSYFHYLREWDEVLKSNNLNLPFHLLSYERLKMDSLGEIIELNKFLETDRPGDFLESVKDACTFQSIKTRKGGIYVGKNGEDTMYRKVNHPVINTMKEVLVSDAGGATLRLVDYGGKTLRPLFFSEESLKSSHSLPLRPDDIILCSYPKSGCHWTWDISRMLLDGDMSNINCQHKEDFMLENTTVKKAEMMTSPRLLSTHMQFSELPLDDLRKHQNKIIFVYRNPKDLAVSLFYMHRSIARFDYNGKFDDYLSLFFSGNVDYGSYFDYLREWDQVLKSNNLNLPFHLLSYERLKMDSLGEIIELNKFLETDRSGDFLESVNDACTFQSIKTRKGAKYVGKNGEDAMYRKGIVGEWKDHFTVARNDEIEDIIKTTLSHVQFEFKYEI